METTVWRQLPTLVENLLQNSQSFTFFQAVKILEDYLKTDDNTESWWQRIRLIPAAGLAFPSADIQRCYLDNKQRFVIELNFMGLYGVDSVLPNYFLHQTALENSNSECLRQFLMIFNQSSYRLLYLAWKKSQPHWHCEKTQQYYSDWLNTLITGNQKEPATFTSANFFNQRTRNRTHLINLLKSFLPTLNINIKTAHPTYLPTADQWHLGKTIDKLGDNIVLANRVLDNTSEILIQIGPMTNKEMATLLPTTTKGKQLAKLISQFLPIGINFRLLLLFQSEQSPQLLGKSELQLGINTALDINPKTYHQEFKATRYLAK